jgi:predicted GTPase
MRAPRLGPGDHDSLRSLIRRLSEADAAPLRARAVNDLMARLAAGRVRLVLVGEAKRGKSSLANALLGRALLPTGVTPVTAFTTDVVQDSHEGIDVTLLDGSVVCDEVESLADYVTQQRNPGNERHVAHVTVRVKTGLPHESVTLVDTPGMGSVFTADTERASEELQRMDAAILVLTVDAPCSAAELELLRTVADHAVRTVIVLNKADRLTTAERVEAEQFLRRVVEEATGTVPPILSCSTRAVEDPAPGREPTSGDLPPDALARGIVTTDLRQSEFDGISTLGRWIRSNVVEPRTFVLHRSIAAAARRLTQQAADEAHSALAIVTAEQSQRARLVADLAGIAAQADDRASHAQSLVTAMVHAFRAQLDAAAQAETQRLRHQARRLVQTELEGSASRLGGGELEAVIHHRLEQLVAFSATDWHAGQHARMSGELQSHLARQQDALDRDAADIQGAVRRQLGLHLTSTAVELPTADVRYVALEPRPEIGWDSALFTALRRRGGRRSARARIGRYLIAECDRLADQALGRARSDLQDRLEQSSNALRSQLRDCYSQQSEGLRRALVAATDPASLDIAQRPLTIAKIQARLERLHAIDAALARLLEQLPRDASATRPRRDVGRGSAGRTAENPRDER